MGQFKIATQLFTTCTMYIHVYVIIFNMKFERETFEKIAIAIIYYISYSDM